MAASFHKIASKTSSVLTKFFHVDRPRTTTRTGLGQGRIAIQSASIREYLSFVDLRVLNGKEFLSCQPYRQSKRKGPALEIGRNLRNFRAVSRLVSLLVSFS